MAKVNLLVRKNKSALFCGFVLLASFYLFYLRHFIQNVFSWIWPQYFDLTSRSMTGFLNPSSFLDMAVFVVVALLSLYQIFTIAKPKKVSPALKKWPHFSCSVIALFLFVLGFGCAYGIGGVMGGFVYSTLLRLALLFAAVLTVWFIYSGRFNLANFIAISHVLGLLCLTQNIMFGGVGSRDGRLRL
jgi:hypothetical protein